MKNIFTIIIFYFILSCGYSQIILNEGFEQHPCATSYPSDWMVTDSPIYTDSCTGYTTIYGTEEPSGPVNNHYFQIVTYDRSIANRRDYLGHLLTEAVYPGDMLYVEFGISHGDSCKWFSNGLGFCFSYGYYPNNSKTCNPDLVADWHLPFVFYTDSNWTAAGAFITITDTADRVTIGNFLCDDDVALDMDSLRPVDKAVYSVDNVHIFRVSTGVESEMFAPANYSRSFNLQGIEVPKESEGVTIDEYISGEKRYYKKRITIK